MDKKYCVIVKSGDSELRAVKNLSKTDIKKILPIIELTRGRAKNIGTREAPIHIYPYDKKIKNIVDIFSGKGKTIALDVTSEETLSSEEIDKLFNYQEGYKNWTDEVIGIKEKNVSLIPSIIMNYDDDSFEKNLKEQINILSEHFDTLMYRYSIDNEIAIEDIKMIKKLLPQSITLFIVIDCGWIPTASYKNVAEVCIDKIGKLKEVLGETRILITVCATTFPNNVSEIGDDVTDEFEIGEIKISEKIQEKYPEVIYGDYGSINPIRNDQIIMSRGWIPRIDVALPDKIYYYRRRRPNRTSIYANTYNMVAKDVVSDKRFPSSINEWGFNQITNCALGDAPSSSPSFWISVRMNSHIVQQIKRLGL